MTTIPTRHPLATTLLSTISTEPFALTFAGQATPWRESLSDLTLDAAIQHTLAQALAASDDLVSPIGIELTTLGAARLPILDIHVETVDTHAAQQDSSPELSVPGIVLAQYGTLQALAGEGLDVRAESPRSVAGHSQGVLGVELFKAWSGTSSHTIEQVITLARLIGAAAGQETRRLSLLRTSNATAMLSVKGVSHAALLSIVEATPNLTHPVTIGVRNDYETHVLSGAPQDLLLVRAALTTPESSISANGQAPLPPADIVTEFLDVGAPFHSPLMEDAVTTVARWAEECGLDRAWAIEAARAVLTEKINWPAQINTIIDEESTWVLDCGPGVTLSRITSELVTGTGVTVLQAGVQTLRHKLSTVGFEPDAVSDWSAHTPQLIDLPDGETVLDTAFSRLTGRSPVLLAGMTPTTVDPEIVSAAANAGFWAELAGGGQVTEEVYAENLEQLKEQLEPGVTATFNSMYLDRYLWNLQFGSQRIVSKSRLSGAPLDGVVISAGVPELDEALELIDRLRREGFPYVVFKPGTVQQILNTIQIARSAPDVQVIAHVEDGHSGGHHSWENLDDLLLQTYAKLRATPNLVVCVGGGIGTPERAADYLTGQWATRHGRRPMPVDGVLVGTAAMTVKEARTTPEVKQVLLDTVGIDPNSTEGPWITPGTSRGGMTSGLSHLRADMHEVDNSAAAAARLIAEIGNDQAAVLARKPEVIETLSRTCRPYFGDLETMTYEQWVRRFVDLSHPWTDPTWAMRFQDLLQRVEARLSPIDHGDVVTLFGDLNDVLDGPTAADRLIAAYPSAASTLVTPIDAAWFPALCRSHPKPLPFVPVLDDDLLTWWGQDGLWQAQDERYPADAVRIIPGPISVAGIDRVDEPVADLLTRFEQATVTRLKGHGAQSSTALARIGALEPARSLEDFIRTVPHIMWTGHLITNPAIVLPDYRIELVELEPADDTVRIDMVIHLDTAWDEDTDGITKHAVRRLVFPLLLPPSTARGSVPVIDEGRLPEQMTALLSATAGVGSTSISGDVINALPAMRSSTHSLFGEAHYSFRLSSTLGPAHAGVTAAALPAGNVPRSWVPDALLGPAWPAIYAALGSATYADYPVIEGLLNAVHLDHVIEFSDDPQDLIGNSITNIDVTSWVADIEDSVSGRLVTVALLYEADGTVIGAARERFAIQGRALGARVPSEPPLAGGSDREIKETPRSTLSRTIVRAPNDMTPFAIVSGDFNPIHTSATAASVAGLSGPLVHGMWLSATVQHAICAADANNQQAQIHGWTYSMFGPVDLEAEIEITVERVGLVVDGGLLLEATSRIDGTVVSKGTAITRAPKTAYVYPGQGIQAQGMGLAERALCPAVDEIWKRADAHTRSSLGFSIIAIVRDNPTQITANGVTYRHPDGVLHLTQFTQVALATLAFAQTERMRYEGVLVSGAVFAGHSLGEYNALAAYAQVFGVETVIELVFHRGSKMHALVERDENGRSNYRMGVLRPDQLGLSDAEIVEYIAEIADACGEFLEIVNFNLAGKQYAIAGTVRGLEVLDQETANRAEATGGRKPFMLVPGIDVPFHSAVLHGGVADFRQKLEEHIPHDIDVSVLIGRYIPNLVARPFEITREFATSILNVVPSEIVPKVLASPEAWTAASADQTALGRMLLIELLSWQFASPVRWIETQAALFGSENDGGLAVAECVEIGLGASPTLANLAERTLSSAEFAGRNVVVSNLQRDEARVLHTDIAVVDVPEVDSDTAAETQPDEPARVETPATATTAAAGPAQTSMIQTAVSAGTDVADLPFTAADALRLLVAHSARIRLDQIHDHDTTDSLTNGVSSRRNQLLMDLSSELGLSSIDGAAEADVSALSTTVNRLAHNYQAFGPVLRDAVRDRLRKLLGAAGAKATRIEQRVRETWGLESGWVSHVTGELLLGTRDGSSTREGDLATLTAEVPTSVGAVDELIDAAVQATGARHGISVALPTAGGGGSDAMIDSAALNAFADTVTGPQGVLASTARHVLEVLGLESSATSDTSTGEHTEVLETVRAELGANWLSMVEPAFAAERAVLLDDRWASAREDLARLWTDKKIVSTARFVGAGTAVSAQARWWAKQAESAGDNDLAEQFNSIADDAEITIGSTSDPAQLRNDIAVVTGMTPDSIAGAVVRRLLAEGATVIATTSRLDSARLQFAKAMYREYATPGAQLWLLPANLSSYRDVDDLVDWIGSAQTRSVGGSPVEIKPAMLPTLFFPFAAPSVNGTLGDAGPSSETQMRLLLWSVERMIAGLGRLGSETNVQHRLHVVLPGSPNRGTFGGDGAYAEAKSAFDAIVTRWRVESDWSERVTLAHPQIGWVRGTGLMGHNDPLVDAVERAGVHTWSSDEMANELITLCSAASRVAAATAPVEMDLTGGLNADLDLTALKSAIPAGTPDASENEDDVAAPAVVAALPSPTRVSVTHVDPEQWGPVSANLDDAIVIVGQGEVGPWGSARTRFEAELGITPDGEVDLTPAGVLELAWMTGLVTWRDTPVGGWYTAAGELVPEGEIFERYRDEVVARSGVRFFVQDGPLEESHSPESAAVFLDRDITFTVADEAEARSYLDADPQFTRIAVRPDDGEWTVTRLAGGQTRVPRRATLRRLVGGQFPSDFDPARWGIPAAMIDSIDRIAVWNLVTAVDAFISSGFSPAELLEAVHPADVASTQGTGFGGMTSMRRLFVDRFLGEGYPQDILQETLPNVVAAHTMQSYVGGYGPMINPVGACATAAVSLDEAVDKITCGKADFVVAGAIDDIQVESIEGFGSMNATADSQAMLDQGIDARFISRANDRRRAGFVESQGGGTLLVTRGSIALKLGLPVLAVVASAQTFADGAHTSIPAPGIGALAAARGGHESRLARGLAAYGVDIDDVSVVSKHDTSTNANDPNEADLHTRLGAALGRTAGNPLFVISQKTVVGHTKGGAAVFQVGGLAQVFRTGRIPANAALDCVDEEMQQYPDLVWLRRPLDLGAQQLIRAAFLTSLGFGHVSSIVALVHPGAFEAMVAQSAETPEAGMQLLRQWRVASNARIAEGVRHRESGMLGRTDLFVPVENRRLPAASAEVDPHEVEAAMLLDPTARLNGKGRYRAPARA